MSTLSMSDFEVVSFLGKGTTGSVYKVRRRADGALLVVKAIMLTGYSEVQRREIINEVTVMSRASHPNVIAYEGSFVERDTLHIVMELAGGGDLAHLIKAQAGVPLGEEQIWSVVVQVSEGLQHLHERRILHRDIKAMNIFTDARGAVKIGDLGLARLLPAHSSHARTGVGTPLYFSPEMCEERPYNEKSDVWALGCLVYELCSLRPPFLASNQMALARKILTTEPVPLPAAYSMELHFLASKMLEKDAARRPSAKQILQYSPVRARRAAIRAELGLPPPSPALSAAASPAPTARTPAAATPSPEPAPALPATAAEMPATPMVEAPTPTTVRCRADPQKATPSGGVPFESPHTAAPAAAPSRTRRRRPQSPPSWDEAKLGAVPASPTASSPPVERASAAAFYDASPPPRRDDDDDADDESDDEVEMLRSTSVLQSLRSSEPASPPPELYDTATELAPEPPAAPEPEAPAAERSSASLSASSAGSRTLEGQLRAAIQSEREEKRAARARSRAGQDKRKKEMHEVRRLKRKIKMHEKKQANLKRKTFLQRQGRAQGPSTPPPTHSRCRVAGGLALMHPGLGNALAGRDY